MFEGMSTEVLQERLETLVVWEMVVERTKGVAAWSDEFRGMRWLVLGDDDPDDPWNSMALLDEELGRRE